MGRQVHEHASLEINNSGRAKEIVTCPDAPAGTLMVMRCSGTRAPLISTSHSSSSQFRKRLSTALCTTALSSGQISGSGMPQSRLPGLHTPQCSTMSALMSVMMSTRMGLLGVAWRTTAGMGEGMCTHAITNQ